MPEHELWVTALFNNYLSGPARAVLTLAGLPAAERPWANFVTLQVVVFLFLVIVFALLRPRLSMDKPGKLQHFFEIIYTFLKDQAEEIVGHDGPKHLHAFATVFIFILFANLLGVLPLFESPTMFPPVPLGCALAAFLYYHVAGAQSQGVGRYIAHFAGPMPALAPLMFPIEIISHLGRVLSLTVRLFANMFASENVFLIFVSLAPLAIPSIFLAEHMFKALLQAYIFALLTMVYVQGAVVHDH
jgi:F-type H+-transporting ATPase subunit a